MKELLESESFAKGVNVGICLYQKKVILAHEHKEPLKVGDTLYFLQDGRERLAEVLNEICK